MRLLILTPEFDGRGGGIMTFYQALAPALRAGGIDLHIIEGSAVHSSEDRTVRVVDGIKVETLEQRRLLHWVNRFSAFAAAPSLQHHLAAAWAMWEQAEFGRDADIVEACDWGLLFLPPAVEAACPLIVQCHGSVGQIATHDPIEGEELASAFLQLIERAVLAVAGAVQTYSGENARFWRGETGRDVEVIRPAWAPAAAPGVDAVGSHGLVIGRLQRWKGPDVLAVALEKLGPKAPIVNWVGRDTAWGVRKMSTAAHLGRAFPSIWNQKIVHHSPMPPGEVARQQASALFNLVPSTWDVFNFTAIEAMASGRPTIVSTGAGASELIEDGVNGFLFEAGDPNALAGALDRLLGESPTRLAEIGRGGQNTVRSSLAPDKIAARRMAAYKTAIEDFNQRPNRQVTGWLGQICRPQELRPANLMAFLEHLPLRPTAAHVFHRLVQKITGRTFGHRQR